MNPTDFIPSILEMSNLSAVQFNQELAPPEWILLSIIVIFVFVKLIVDNMTYKV